MNNPKIRFKRYTDDWEQHKLGEVFKERTERANGDEELLSVTIGNGVIRQADSDKRNIASEDKSNYKIVRKGDVPYNSMRMWQGAVGNSEYDGIVSPAYTVLVPTAEASGKFFMELFKKETTLKIFQRWSQGLTSDTWNLKYPILSSIGFYMPSLKEQTKIAEYFQRIDRLINLHQHKCEEIKTLKKYMIQKMFPQNGMNIPEIRFNGFTDDWEQRKLAELATMHARIGWQNLRTSEFLNEGEYMLITGTDFEDGTINYSTCHYVEKERYEQDKNIQIRNGSILITKDGTLGKVAYVQGLTMPATLNAGVFNVEIKDENTTDEKYLFQYLKTPFLINYVVQKATGGTIKHLNQNILVDLPVAMPCQEEQMKIGEYFSCIDTLITLHQQKCNELQSIKKFMLQNMFV